MLSEVMGGVTRYNVCYKTHKWELRERRWQSDWSTASQKTDCQLTVTDNTVVHPATKPWPRKGRDELMEITRWLVHYLIQGLRWVHKWSGSSVEWDLSWPDALPCHQLQTSICWTERISRGSDSRTSEVKVADLCPASLGSIPTGILTRHWWQLEGHPTKTASVHQQSPTLVPHYLDRHVPALQTRQSTALNSDVIRMFAG